LEDLHTIEQRLQNNFEAGLYESKKHTHKPRSVTVCQRRGRRGWDGLDPVHEFRATGVEDKLTCSIVGLLAFMFLIVPHNPETNYSLLQNENTHLLLKLLVLSGVCFVLYCVVFRNTRVITTSAGFYHCYLWTKKFTPWAQSSHFVVCEYSISRDSAFIPDKKVEYVYYRNARSGCREEIRMSNFSAKVLCSMLNQEREKYLGMQD